jgi:uncharacterized RDD family membrane protein YckC
MTEFNNLDTVRHIAIPEGCEISLRVSGPVIRAWAWLIDFLIRVAIWIGIGGVLKYLGDFGTGFFFISAFLLEWFYPVLFEVLWHGQTPGKNMCGIAVILDDGTPVNWNASFIRNTLRFVDFAPLMYAVGFVTMMLNRDGKRLGDLVAGTIVAYIDKKERATAPKNYEGAETPPFPLTLDEQRALIEFRNRAGSLTEERANELAIAAEPLTRGLLPGQAKSRLFKIANYLLGER